MSTAWLRVGALVLCGLPFSTACVNADTRPEVLQLLQAGTTQYQQGNLAGAVQNFEQALLADPTNDEAMAWIDQAGYALLIKMMGANEPKLQKVLWALERTISTEVRRRSSDAEAVNTALTAYFGFDDVVERTRQMHTMITAHGMYLIPGLAERLGSAEQPVRVRAIQALVKLNEDAVVPLCRTLQHSDANVVLGSIAVLNAVRSAAAAPSLKALAERTKDEIIREQASAALMNCDSSKGKLGAYELLLEQATRFYLDSDYMNLSYHEPVIWSLDDAGKLSFKSVHGWALNELRAEQFIGDALAAKPNGVEAQVLGACNVFAQYAEYVAVADAVESKADEARKTELKAESLSMHQVRNRAASLSFDLLLRAVERSLAEHRPEVAIEAITSIRDALTPGTRVASVPSVLDKAQTFEHRGVRFAASECVTYMNPLSFAGSQTTVDNLAEALVDSNRRLALTVFSEQEDALHVADLLRKSNTASFNEPSSVVALQRAFSYPHDLIVLDANLAALLVRDIVKDKQEHPAAEMIRRLRADYRTKDTPILVIARDEKVDETRLTFEKAENRVFVTNRSVDALRLRDDVVKPQFAAMTGERAREGEIALRAAHALEFLTTRDSVFPAQRCAEEVVEVLENRDEAVRTVACKIVAALGISAAQGNLINIWNEGESASPKLRCEVLLALGALNHGKGTVDSQVDLIFTSARDSQDVQIQRASAISRGRIQSATMKN
ncbi:MAG: HEAT repeat domain-containing protein [Planctomycetota bacterium]